MRKRYSKTEISRILRQELSAGAQTEEKIQEVYGFIRAEARRNQTDRRINQAEGRRAEAIDPSGALKSKEVRQDRLTGRTFGKRRWILTAAAAVLAVSSVTAVALNGVFQAQKEKREEKLTYDFEINYQLKPVAVQAEPGYIPEGYRRMGELSKWCRDDRWQDGITIISITANELDLNGESLDADNVKSVEETEINGLPADLITINYDQERMDAVFDKRIYLFNEEKGYVTVIYGGNDLSMEELRKVAESITYTESETELEYANAQEKQKNWEMEEEILRQGEQRKQLLEYGVPGEYVYQIGETFNPRLETARAYLKHLELRSQEMEAEWKAEQGIEITVTGVQVLDTMSGYAPEKFFDYEDAVAPHLLEDGSLESYTRVTYEGIPGMEIEPKELERKENVERKFLRVDVTATNLGEETAEFWAAEPALSWLRPAEGNYGYELSWSEPLNRQADSLGGDAWSPLYFDQSPWSNQDPGFYICDLEPQQTLAYTLLYAVDGDRLENLFLRWGNTAPQDFGEGMFTSYYVDLNL